MVYLFSKHAVPFSFVSSGKNLPEDGMDFALGKRFVTCDSVHYRLNDARYFLSFNEHVSASFYYLSSLYVLRMSFHPYRLLVNSNNALLFSLRNLKYLSHLM